MEKTYRIIGGTPLFGKIFVQGAKNSVLPMLAAALLTEEETHVSHCPHISDVDTALAILRHLGCGVRWERDILTVSGAGPIGTEITDALMREMRSSVIFLGAILARCGTASVTMPGGCELGPRPIDLHLDALRRMGAEITETGGRIKCTAEKLHGANITLSIPSVGATENILLASVLAQGTTYITNAAQEPEVAELAALLCAMGAHISGAGGPVVTVEGVPRLHGASRRVMPDRIAAATYLSAVMAAGGELELQGAAPATLSAILNVLQEAGGELLVAKHGVLLRAPKRPLPVRTVRTMPYPAFPTDALPPVMAFCCRADGTTVFIDTIFQNRYRHVAELCRCGAEITTHGGVAVVEGVRRLTGARMYATDLRGGASLVIAALAAEGESIISGVGLVERGYEHLPETLRQLGAEIWEENGG